jgi:signal recognition particle receptor subunit beta
VMFDFLPLDYGDVRGLRTRFHLYAVPGQVEYDPRRRLALTGIDGVVFVADSQPERMEENITSVNNLRTNLELQGWNIQEIPLVFQYNKRDLPNAVPVAELRTALNRYNAPDFEAVAASGVGVKEAFHTISKTIINVLKGGDL